MGDQLANQIAGGEEGCFRRRSNGQFVYYLDFSQKPVAAARHRFDVASLFSRFPQRISQSLDGGIDAMVELDHRFVGPKPKPNVLPRHDFAGIFQQQEQELQRLFAEAKAGSVFTQLSGANIQFEGSKTESARPRGSRSSHGEYST
jgi:hypothetical protein